MQKITNITLIKVIDSNKIECKDLLIDNISMNKLANSLQKLKDKGLKLYNEQTIENIFKPLTRYKIEYLKNDFNKSFQAIISDKIIDNIQSDHIPFMKNIKFENIKEYSAIAYSYLKNNKFEIEIYKITGSLYAKNKFGICSNNSDGSKRMQIHEMQNMLYMPTKHCICNINNCDSNKIVMKIFKANDFNDIFKANKIKRQLSKNTINRFSQEIDPLKITKSNTTVLFEKDNFGKVKKEIVDNILNIECINNSFSRFRGIKSNTINTIDIKRLENLVNVLKKHVNTFKDSKFEMKNIPEVDVEKNTIKINENQIAIFSAMLENKIVEKLLNGKIEVPYYS